MKKQDLRKLIKECVETLMQEMDPPNSFEQGTEPYNQETDQFGYAPRDRMEPTSGEGLGIPEYPQAIIKQHNMDGQERWFVYSSPDPQALIIGWGKTREDAIQNGKTTATYIKHGGVGHTGELK